MGADTRPKRGRAEIAGGEGGAPSRLFPPKRMSSRQRHKGSTIMGEVVKELYEYMGTHLEPGEIERRREFLKPASGRPVKSLPEVFREVAEALGIMRYDYILPNKEDI